MLTLQSVLKDLESKTTAKEKTKAEIAPLVTQVTQKICGLIMKNKVNCPMSAGNLSGAIEKMQAKPQLSYEEQLREHRLREVMRIKQELESKLFYVEDQIQVLADKHEADEARRGRARDKETRRQLFEQEEKKRLETEEFARKQMEQQRLLEQRRERLLAEMALAQQQSEAQAKIDAENFQRAQAAERERRIEALRQKRFEREQHLTEARMRMKETKDMKPPETLNMSLPEIETRKPRPVVSLEEIEEHQRKYEERRRAEEERRKQKLPKTYSEPHFPFSKSFMRLSQEERKAKEEADKQAAFKAQILEKQRQYSQLVRTTYFPAIDKKKAEESQSFLDPKPKKPLRSPSADVEKPANLSVVEVPKKKRLRKPKPPSVEIREEKKPVPDYLEELRKVQAGHASKTLSRIQSLAMIDDRVMERTSEENKHEKVIEHSSKMLEKVRKTEAVLSRLAPTQANALEIEENMNSLLIGSIKAKLSLLSPAT